MSQVIEKMNYDEAFTLASEVKEILASYCERIEIAGSVRRKKREGIKDIEIVCQPKFEDISTNLTGEPMKINSLDEAIKGFLRITNFNFLLGEPDKAGKTAPYGPKYYRLKYRGEKLDLFAVLPPAQFGTVFLIRTGDADFSHAFVTRLWQFGLRSVDGHIVRGKETVPTPEESDAFKLCHMEYVEPENRTIEVFRKLEV